MWRVLVLVLLSFIASSNFILALVTYGERCEIYDAEGCDSSKGLKCDEKIKTCVCSEYKAIWSSKDSQCYSDSDCIQRGGNYHDVILGRCVIDKGYSCQNQESWCMEHAECTSRHGDSKYRECRCIGNYSYVTNFSTYRGTCRILKGFGEGCDQADDDCVQNSGLRCSRKGNCECRQGTFWAKEDYKCKSKYGSECSETWDCGRNMYCTIPPRGSYRKSTCTCNYDGHVPNSSQDACTGEYNSRCFGNKADCVHGLACVDDRCKCPNEPDQVYYSKNKTCLTIE